MSSQNINFLKRLNSQTPPSGNFIRNFAVRRSDGQMQTKYTD